MLSKIIGALKLLPDLFSSAEAVRQKGWYQSKTVWKGLLKISAALLATVFAIDLELTDDAIYQMSAALAVIGDGVMDIWLRIKTKIPAGVRPIPESVTEDRLDENLGDL